MTKKYLERQQLRYQAKATALAEARREERERKNASISDVGKAESQPVSIEVMEVAQDEIARLVAENARLMEQLGWKDDQLNLIARIVTLKDDATYCGMTHYALKEQLAYGDRAEEEIANLKATIEAKDKALGLALDRMEKGWGACGCGDTEECARCAVAKALGVVPAGWRELGPDEEIRDGDMWSARGNWAGSSPAYCVIGNTLRFYRECFARPHPSCKAWRQDAPEAAP